MSYDLAVWEGVRPVDDATATATFKDLYRMDMRHVAGQRTSPTPLINNASGPLFYFGMVFSKYEEAAPFSVDLARTLGLICFDPQDDRLLS
ncbi:hypothetical protein Sros01_67940 [Streptomyces roseochromogenus]|nr:hypothetical protein Sros01_67940 [Streptomyces roseochromogenus]